MRSIKRSFAAAGAAALLAASLTACGGGAPTDASVEDYCGIGDELDSILGDLAEDDYEGFVEAAGEAADQFNEVGTPEDIPEDARAGFEEMIDALGSLDADEVESGVEDLQASAEAGEEVDENAIVMDIYGVDEDAADDIDALNEYSSETCNEEPETNEGE